MRDMTDLYMGHDSFIYMMWMIYMCDMTPPTQVIRRWLAATHCNTLQHTAIHCNTLQRTATHCNTLQHTATQVIRRWLAATHCNTLQHTATHCNTLQHTATHCNTLQRRWFDVDSLYFYSQPPWTCDMTRSHLWHDSFPCVTWIILTCDLTHSYMGTWLNFIRVTWLSNTDDSTLEVKRVNVESSVLKESCHT